MATTPLRIGIGGIRIETSTFSPHRTAYEDFTVTRGDEELARYPWIKLPRAWGQSVEWVPTLRATALPGGAVTADAYRELRDELIALTAEAGALDGFLLDIHGAMSVEAMDDAEGDLAVVLRETLGTETLVSAVMDLHGCVSERLIDAVDLITCERTAPHEDTPEAVERAARNLLTRLRQGGRPAKARVTVPVLLPGEMTSTRTDPARSIYAKVPEVEALDGVLDAAVWVGYAWADEPRCQATVVVTGDDRELITTKAEELARAYWDARGEFHFAAPTADIYACLRTALASDKRPFLISDSGDNPTAGGSGDSSFTLHHLLATAEFDDAANTAIFAAVVDAHAVAAAMSAGVGNPITVSVGGKVDRTAQPAELTGIVHSLRKDDPWGGDIAVIRRGGLHVILTSRRKPYHLIADFTELNLDPQAATVVIVKIGYLEPELYEIEADWLLALTPGGVDQDLLRLGHHRINRPMWPFDTADYEPDLTARLF